MRFNNYAMHALLYYFVSFKSRYPTTKRLKVLIAPSIDRIWYNLTLVYPILSTAWAVRNKVFCFYNAVLFVTVIYIKDDKT